MAEYTRKDVEAYGDFVARLWAHFIVGIMTKTSEGVPLTEEEEESLEEYKETQRTINKMAEEAEDG
jgi:hypothetical protein